MMHKYQKLSAISAFTRSHTFSPFHKQQLIQRLHICPSRSKVPGWKKSHVVFKPGPVKASSERQKMFPFPFSRSQTRHKLLVRTMGDLTVHKKYRINIARTPWESLNVAYLSSIIEEMRKWPFFLSQLEIGLQDFTCQYPPVPRDIMHHHRHNQGSFCNGQQQNRSIIWGMHQALFLNHSCHKIFKAQG